MVRGRRGAQGRGGRRTAPAAAPRGRPLPRRPQQVVSKRVANAKSERFLKSGGKKKSGGSLWTVRPAPPGACPRAWRGRALSEIGAGPARPLPARAELQEEPGDAPAALRLHPLHRRVQRCAGRPPRGAPGPRAHRRRVKRPPPLDAEHSRTRLRPRKPGSRAALAPLPAGPAAALPRQSAGAGGSSGSCCCRSTCRHRPNRPQPTRRLPSTSRLPRAPAGVASFFMTLPGARQQFAYGGILGGSDE